MVTPEQEQRLNVLRWRYTDRQMEAARAHCVGDLAEERRLLADADQALAEIRRLQSGKDDT